MTVFFSILIAVLLLLGAFFAVTGVAGILRFPDYFARAQASTAITTLGTIFAVAAGILYAIAQGFGAVWYVKMILIAVMIMAGSSISAHALSKGTYKRGHRPHHGGFVKDDYEEDGFDEL